MPNYSIGDNLYEMSRPVFWKKKEKYILYVVCWKLCPVCYQKLGPRIPEEVHVGTELLMPSARWVVLVVQWKKVPLNADSGQWSPRSDCAGAQSDQGLFCPLTEYKDTQESSWSECMVSRAALNLYCSQLRCHFQFARLAFKISEFDNRFAIIHTECWDFQLLMPGFPVLEASQL